MRTMAPAMFDGYDLVNLCPHDITLYRGEHRAAVVEPTGLARCSEAQEEVGAALAAGMRVPVVRTRFGEVTGLPPREPGKLCIVSHLVALWVSTNDTARDDLVIPHDLVRDASGSVIGARALAQI
jgi:hypothetical protein